jgi:hypothetical protein
MAVLFDAIGPAGGVGQAAVDVTSISWTHTCAGADRVLLVGVSIGGANTTITVTYNGVAMTLVGTTLTGASTGTATNSGRASLYRLVNPPSGAHTVVVTAAAARTLIGGSTSYTGVHQTTPIGTPVTALSSTASIAANVTGTTAGNMVVDHVACGGAIGAFDQTQRYLRNLNGLTGGGNGAGSTAPGGGTVAMGYSRTGTEWWGIVAVELLAVAAAAVQVVRPVSTLHAGLWTPSGAATLHEANDEETASFSDYARSEDDPVDSPAIERLGILREPAGVVADGDVHLHFQYDKEGVGDSALTMELRQGSTSEASPGTLIATLTDENVADAGEDTAVVLTAAQHSSIVYVEGQAADLFARYVARPASIPLTWAPPTGWESFATHVIDAPTTFLDFGNVPTRVIQEVPLTERLSLRSNAHVVWIGGESLIDATVGGPTSTRRATMTIAPSGSGTPQPGRIVHLEGYLVHGKYAMGDIWIDREGDDTATVQVQNCRVEQGMWSRYLELDGFESQHPDCIQPFGGVAELRVDKFTGLLTLQGFFLPRQPVSSGPVSGLRWFRRTNLRPNLNPTIELWDPVEGQPDDGRIWPSWQWHVADDPNSGPDPASGQIRIDNGTASFVHNTPQISAGGSGRAMAPTSGLQRTFDAALGRWYVNYGSNTRFRNWDDTAPGRIYEMPPATPDGDDWVPDGVAGLDYVSPGYM